MSGPIYKSAVVAVAAPVFLITALAAASPEKLIHEGHWKRARVAVEQLYQDHPNEARAAYLLSQVRMTFDDLEGALPLAEKAVSLEGANASYHYQLAAVCGETADKASFFEKAGWAKRSKEEAEKAASLDPKNLDARFLLIEYYLQAPRLMGGDKSKAQTMAEEIGRASPAQGYLAQARLAQQSHDEASQVAYTEKAVAASPRDYDVLVAAAQFYASGAIRQFEPAERLARQAFELDPERADAYIVLAGAYATEGRSTELEAILAESERNVPDDLTPFYQAGDASLLAERDLPGAEKCLRKYLTQEPEGGEPSLARAHWRLGLVLEKQGRKPEAMTELQTALRINPNLKEAKKDLERLQGSGVFDSGF